MKFFRLSVLLSITAAVFAGAMLFMTSQKVQQEEDALSSLRQATVREAAHIRVLRAEWDYLNRPDRLERLVSENMGMDVPESGAVILDVDHVPEPLMVDPPGRKPQFHAQPVSMTSGGMRRPDNAGKAASAPRKPDRDALPPRAGDGAGDFDALLDSLGEGGADE